MNGEFATRLESLVRTWGPRALSAARTVPVPLVASLVAAPLVRRFRKPDAPRARSPDVISEIALWGRQNPELVAGIALGVGALLGGSRLRLLKAGLAVLPRVLPKLLPSTTPG